MLSGKMKAIIIALEKIAAPDCIRVMTSQGSPNYDGQKWVSYADWNHLKEGVRFVLKLAKAFDSPSVEEQIKNYVEKAQPSVYKGGHNTGPSQIKERPPAPTPTSPPQTVSQEVLELIETAQWARNRLENIADAAWHGDERDFKRSLVGVFADFDAALAACGSTIPEEIVSRTKPETEDEKWNRRAAEMESYYSELENTTTRCVDVPSWEAGRDAAVARYAENYRDAEGITGAIGWDWFSTAEDAMRAIKPPVFGTRNDC